MDNGVVLSNSWAEVNLKTIINNKHKVEKRLKDGCKVCCVIKADAYGHGAVEVAKALENDGADYFGVANINEAVELRKNNIKTPILILGYTNPHNANLLSQYNLTQSCFSFEYSKQLSNNLKNGYKIKVHLKINTGMNRIGFNPFLKDTIFEIKEIYNNEKFDVEGIFTHFYDSNNVEATNKQYSAFIKIINDLESEGLKFKIKHCCNSAAAVNFREMQCDMVRLGALLYGINVTDNIKTEEAISLKAWISQIFEIEKGETVSYNALFKANKKTRIAAITAGYADGVARSNFDSLFVTIHGQKCKVIGTICMDQLLVELNNLKCSINDSVTIYGSGGVSIDQIAKNNSTISYEIMCDIGKRVERKYIDK